MSAIGRQMGGTMQILAWLLTAVLTVIAASAQDADADQTPPDSTVPDLSNFDRDALQAIAERLYRRVAELERVLNAARDGGALPQELRAQVRRLQAENAALRRENESLRAANASAGDRGAATPAEPSIDIFAEQPDLPRTGSNAHRYTYQYELSLVSIRGHGRMKIRHSDGSRSKLKYTYEEYRDDVIEVRVFFRNASSQTARFSFIVGVGRGGKFAGTKPVMLGRGSYSTPALIPDEVHEFTLEIPVKDPGEVEFAEIGRMVSVAE